MEFKNEEEKRMFYRNLWVALFDKLYETPNVGTDFINIILAMCGEKLKKELGIEE